MLYHAVTAGAGRYVQGGGCTSVGVAGLVQSGGFGSFSKAFGNAASGLLEAEVVTADGRVRVANACSNPDLFWALKGGGGGSFGVVTRLTLRTHELPEFFGAAWGTIKARSDEAFRRLLARFLAFYADSLCQPALGRAVRDAGTDNSLKISMVCQGLSAEEARKVWQPFFAWVQAAPADFTVTDELGTGAKAARHWWDIEGNRSMIRRPARRCSPTSRLVAGRPGSGRRLPARLRFAVAARLAAQGGRAAAARGRAVRREPLQGGRAAL